MVKYVILPLGKGRPCLVLDTLLLQEGVGCLLLKKWVSFQLVHGRLDLVMQEKVLQALAGKARHADGPHTSLLVEPLHGPPCGIVVAVRFVHQVKIEVIEA